MEKADGLSTQGDWTRIRRVMERAEAGEKLTLGFFGGSITQGSLASTPENCYAYHVYEWWQKTFPRAEFTFRNAGIGATDSQFGCARAEEDLLSWHPDFVVIDFSVNDEPNGHFLETFEGVIRKIYGSPEKPAVLILHNVMYDTGASAELLHAKVARHYGIPAVSAQRTIYRGLLAGQLENREITPDDLHPNDRGHALLASVITDVLERIRQSRENADTEGMRTGAKTGEKAAQDTKAAKTCAGNGKMEAPGTETAAPCRKTVQAREDVLPAPLTMNAYEDSVRYRNTCGAVTDGFVPDFSAQDGITDIFKNGWTAAKKGDTITFKVSGSCIGVQYRKTMRLPAPAALAVVDGDCAHAVTLDANFDETWGDKLVLATLADHIENREHTVQITLKEAPPDAPLPFYLVSVIASGRNRSE